MKYLFLISFALTACLSSSSSNNPAQPAGTPDKTTPSPRPQTTPAPNTPSPTPTPIGHPQFTTAEPTGCHKIKAIHFSGDLLTAYEIRYTGMDSGVDPWNVLNGKPAAYIEGHSFPGSFVSLDDVTLSQDEQTLIGLTAYNRVYLWNLKTGKTVSAQAPGYVYGIGISPKADLISFVYGTSYYTSTHKTLVYDATAGKIIYEEPRPLYSMGFSLDSSTFYSLGVIDQSRAFIARDLKTGSIKASYIAYNFSSNRLSNSADGKLIYAASDYGITAYDAETLKVVSKARTDWKMELKSLISRADFTPDLSYVQSDRHSIHRGSDGKYVFDGARPGNHWPVAMQFSKDGKMLALAYEDGIVDIRSVGDWKVLHRMCGKK